MHTRAPRHCPAPSAAYHAEADLWFAVSFCSLLRDGSYRLRRRLNRAGDGPDEAHHLAGYGDIDDIGCLAASPQAPIASAQPNLRFPSDVADDLWQRLDAVDLMTADARPHSVGPCAFNQRAAGVTVAGLRDTAAPNGLATRSLSGDKAEIRHELARISGSE